MPLINKNHPEIFVNKSGKNYVFVTILKDEMYFTSEAAKRFGLVAGKYIQFHNEGKEWMFFQNDDPDGFMLHADPKPSSKALKILNKPLLTMFRKSTGLVGTVRLALYISDAEVNGFRMVEINTKKSYDQLMKAV